MVLVMAVSDSNISHSVNTQPETGQSASTASLPDRMTPQERGAAGWLASIFALRMLGLFMILPVFALAAKTMPGGDNPALIGLTMGIYGLTQAVFQIPLGWASDRLGRKPVIIAGLVLFAVGSLMAALATDLNHLLIARSIQGAGAISAAVTAFLADLTREEHRSKAMAMVGGSIGLTFALSLMGAPALYSWVGLSGLFALTAILSVMAIGVVVFKLPAEPARLSAHLQPPKVSWKEAVLKPDLLRLNVGIFTLHLTQMAMFVVMPGMILHTTGYAVAQHWKIYLPVVLISFVLMIPPMIWAEKQGKTKVVKLLAIAGMGLIQASYMWLGQFYWGILTLLVLYFVAFNLLEAMLPSWVSRVAPANKKGLALGVYNTTQALGLFCGGALGGTISKAYGPSAVFEMIAVLTAVWFIAAAGLKALPKRSAASTAAINPQTANA